MGSRPPAGPGTATTDPSVGAKARRRGAKTRASTSQMPPVTAQASTKKAGKSKFMDISV
jgi:hypothetical protein